MGRIAAFLDAALADRWCRGTGTFGFLECERDDDVAAALLEAAESALAEAGSERVLGPVNLTTHDEVGLLVDGFERAPSVLTPYNPEFYRSHLESAGYRPFRDYHAYEWRTESPIAPSLARVARRWQHGDHGVRVRPVDPARWDAELRLLFVLYNDSFSDVWGFVPMTFEEFAERAAQFRLFYRPELALIAEADGVPAGFGLLLPDVNEALLRAGGRLFPLGWLHLMRAIPKIRAGRFILLGVRSELAGRGVAPLLVLEMGHAARRCGLTRVEASLVLEENRRMRHVIEAFGCTRTRTYRLYAKELLG